MFKAQEADFVDIGAESTLPHVFECFGEEVRSAEPFFAVLAALGKTDLFRTHEVPKIKAVLDTLSLALYLSFLC